MSKYDELVKALQWCAKPIPCSKTECPRKNTDEDCACHVLQDAAAAIEELQAEVDTLKRTDSKRCQECLYLGQPVGEQLIPKRGKWIIHGEPPVLVIECSVCGQKYFNHVMQEKAKYCSMCGAKMEVQE